MPLADPVERVLEPVPVVLPLVVSSPAAGSDFDSVFGSDPVPVVPLVVPAERVLGSVPVFVSPVVSPPVAGSVVAPCGLTDLRGAFAGTLASSLRYSLAAVSVVTTRSS